MILRLNFDNHSHEDVSEKPLEVYPRLYSMNDMIIEELITKIYMKRRHRFTWSKKWLYFSEHLNEYKLNEERTKAIMYLNAIQYQVLDEFKHIMEN